MPETVTPRIREGGSYVSEKDPATGEEVLTKVEETAPNLNPGGQPPPKEGE